MDYRYVCRKDDPSVIKMGGYVESWEGKFDSDVYMEVEGPWPSDGIREKTVADLLPEVEKAFEEFLIPAIPVPIRSALRISQAGIRESLAAGDLESAVYLVNEANLSDFEYFRTQLLNVLNSQGVS